MNGLSLFTGIGGLDLAFEAAGGRVAAMCEIEPFCRAVLARHWPDVPIFEDIKTLRGEQIGAVDVIFGGFPCQPFSVAGNQKGQDDDRYLWPEFLRLVGEIRPLWVVAENVPGILNIAADEVCADLERHSYEVGIWNFEAAAVGAPHRRARIFFVGYSERGGLPRLSWRRTGEESTDGCSNVAYRDSSRQLQQSGSLGEFREWAGDCCEDVPDSTCERCGTRRAESEGFSRESGVIWCGGRQFEPRLGGVADGLSPWLDGDCWRKEPDIPRVARGVPDRTARLRALGNAVVPAQAFPIFQAIMEVADD